MSRPVELPHLLPSQRTRGSRSALDRLASETSYARLALELLEERALLTGVSPVGAEFRVNSYTTNDQRYVALASDSSGNFVVAWDSDGQDGDLRGIFAQRYDSSGVAQGSEFLVNSYTDGDQRDPAAAMDTDGNFVIVWNSDNQEGSQGVYAQRYAADGTALGAEFRVNDFTNGIQAQPSVAMNDVGDFVVAWWGVGVDTGGAPPNNIYARRFNSAGVAQGNDFRVNSTTLNGLMGSVTGWTDIAMNSSGDFVVAMVYSDGPNGLDVFARQFDAAGVAIAEDFRVNSSTSGNQSDGKVAMDELGNFVVTWVDQAINEGDVYAKRFNAAGVAQGTDFRVNTRTTSAQMGASVAMDEPGKFVVSWWSQGQDAGTVGVYAQSFNANGSANGIEFRVNTYTANNQVYPSMAMNAAGDFVVAWESSGQDGSGAGIFAQRYSATQSLVVGRYLFYNESKYDGNLAAIGADDDNAIAINKTALLPGTPASAFSNVSSYSKGVNGVMIDILGPHGIITASDFVFRVGNNNTPTTWAPAPAPISISIRTGAGVSGSDRLEIVWANNAIKKTWLEVISLVNANTKLQPKVDMPFGQGDVFFFGSAPGDSGTGNTSTDATVNTTDEIAARNHPQTLFNNIPLTYLYDYNRDGRVDTTDQLIARNNPTSAGNVLKFIVVANPPAAPELSPSAGDYGSVSALAVPSNRVAISDAGIPPLLFHRLEIQNASSGRIGQRPEHLAEQRTQSSRRTWFAVDQAVAAHGLNESWVDSLSELWLD